MKTESRIGAALGGISIVFSILCFAVTPVFTAAFILAALFGAVSGAVVLALKARRTAIVSFVFALAPFCGFLLMQYVVERVGSSLVVFIPLGLAIASAAWALVDYSKARRAPASATA